MEVSKTYSNSNSNSNSNNNNNNNNNLDEDDITKCHQNASSNGCSEKTSNGTVANNGGRPSADPGEDPRRLIPELCNHFYHLGWASGTGGGLSIRRDGRIYCAPSGVQKERIKPEDMFVLDEMTGEILERPANDKLKCSECLSLFMVAFKLRAAGCCIHSHSLNANLVTALHSQQNIDQQRKKWLTSGRDERLFSPSIKTINEFRVRNQEMIKGIKVGSSNRSLNYNDTLVVPIIDNVLYERDLAGAMHEAVSKYPDSNAVLVRNHGVYVWGNTWQQAKSMAECYDYLFRLKLEAAKHGFDWMIEA